jgi:hypothetical protein
MILNPLPGFQSILPSTADSQVRVGGTLNRKPMINSESINLIESAISDTEKELQKLDSLKATAIASQNGPGLPNQIKLLGDLQSAEARPHRPHGHQSGSWLHVGGGEARSWPI